MDSPEFLRDCDPTRRLEVHRWKVRTKTAGFIDVAVIDTEDEAVLTRRSVEVVEPVGLLLAVSQKSQPDGSYSLRVGSTLRISARPAGKADEPLLGRDSVTFTWSDDAIVSSTTTANVNAATARRPGTATLTIASGAVQQTVVVNAFDY